MCSDTSSPSFRRYRAEHPDLLWMLVLAVRRSVPGKERTRQSTAYLFLDLLEQGGIYGFHGVGCKRRIFSFGYLFYSFLYLVDFQSMLHGLYESMLAGLMWSAQESDTSPGNGQTLRRYAQDEPFES